MNSRKWYIRRSDGRVLEFIDLASMRGAIDAGMVDVTDEVSRNQEDWNPLTSIAEFQSLFQHRSNTSRVPVVEAFSQAAKPFEEPDFDAGLNHLTGQMATVRGQRPTQFQNRSIWRTIVMSMIALAFGAIVAWGTQLMMESNERDEAAQELIVEAEALFEKGEAADLEKALSLLDDIKALERSNYASTTLAGRIFLMQARNLDRQREEGRRTLSEEGVNGDPQRLELEGRLAALSKEIETKAADSFLAFQEVIALNPEHVAARQGMLLLAMFRGQRPEVAEEVAVLQRLTPQDPMLKVAEAWSLAGSAPAQSYDLLVAAQSAGYASIEADRLFAQILIELRKWEELNVWLSGAQEIKRLPAWELERLAAIAEQLQEVEAALAQAKQAPPSAAAIAEETDGALLKRAAQLRRRDKPKSAARVYRRVIDRNPKPPVEALVGLGWSLFDLNLPYESQEVFRRAIERVPKAADAHLGLAEVLRSLDDPAALEHFEIYLKLRPTADDADYVKRVIEQLR